MNFLYWNVRSFGNSDTKIALNNFYLSHKPSIISLAEPMITFTQVPSWYWHSIGVTKYCTNVKDNLMPNLWALWGSEVTASVIFVSSQCIALELTLQQSSVYIAAIYASNSISLVVCYGLISLTCRAVFRVLGCLLGILTWCSMFMKKGAATLLCELLVWILLIGPMLIY
jgi:hypothetical protein